jgi:hypothetical protein
VGQVVTVKGLFALILPGPVILVHGKANFLATPPDASEPTDQGVFNALAVLDALAGNIQLNIDASWSKAQVIDISASAEAYFDFANPRNWHFYLGQDTPEDRRIRADFIGLFHGDAYLMVDMDGIVTGAGISWGYDWKFGPVKVILRAWIGAAAAITWQPPQLEGSLEVGGEFEISVAGFGIGLSAEARLSGKAPSLYWVKGELEISVKLPVPLKDLDETVVLEWREEKAPIPIEPFESIGLEHPKVDETWTATVDEYQSSPYTANYEAGPLVPLDARPSIVFKTNMKDVTEGGSFDGGAAYLGGVQIGEYTFDYELQAVLLEKWSKAGSSGWTAVEEIYGAWMAVEDNNGEPAKTRLQLWAKSPFAFTRQTSRTYRDSFLTNHLNWPCTEMPEVATHCVDWEDVDLDTPFGPFFDRGGLHFSLLLTDTVAVVATENSSCDATKALHIDGSWKFLWIVFPEPAQAVELCLDGLFAAARAYANGELLEQILNPGPGLVGFQTPGLDAIGLWSADDGLLARVCWQSQSEADTYIEAFEHNLRVVAGLQRWASEDEILEPETWYRLTVSLDTVATHNGASTHDPKNHYAYFHTGGPPGLGLEGLALPAGEEDQNIPVPYPLGGKLTNLKEYIQWTIPGDGEQPVYRAYDLGADFNENYVEQMYGADMVIRLLDANAQPVLDAGGNEIQFSNQWAEQPTAELSETEYPYTSRAENCIQLPNVYYFPDQRILFANGVLLDEDFSGDLDQWNDPHPENGGEWTIVSERLVYINMVFPVLDALLVAGDSAWGDYAVEVTLTDADEDLGVACRYTNVDVEAYYRLRLNGSGRFLEKVVDGAAMVLWQDTIGYEPGANAKLSLYCQGSRLRGQLDGELLFDLEDEAALLVGQVGIFTNAAAAFEHFLVRTWPGSALAPQTMYRADLMASHVLFVGGLVNGWTDDSAYSWVNLTRNNARLAAFGRTDWSNYRVEVNASTLGSRIGILARFQQDPGSGTFACYRLYLNVDDQRIVLSRLQGTFNEADGTFDLEAAGRSVLWDCDGEACGIDFTLDTHTLALTCDGDWLVVEIDDMELASEQDLGGLSSGKAGLYYLGADDPDFTELVIRSAPRQPVIGWQFITSRYEGFVEHLDTFKGLTYREEVNGIKVPRFENKLNAAWVEMTATSQILAASRSLLASAEEDEVTILREETQSAVQALQTASAKHYGILYKELLGDTYRPLPLVVELSQIVSGEERYALLLESPEPLEWSRLVFELRILEPTSGTYLPIEELLTVWSDDGARAFFFPINGASLAVGDYQLQMVYSLDIGLEAPLQRRGGSTLPEIAQLKFKIQYE